MLQTISTKTIMNSCMSACKRIPVKRVAAFLGMFLFCAVMTFAQSKYNPQNEMFTQYKTKRYFC